MNRKAWGIGALALLACIAVGAWWSYTFEYVEDDIDSPLHGEARYNPLYALKKVLQARGIDAVSRANLNLQAMSLSGDDTLVLTADVRTLTRAQVDDLVDWIEEGGQLVFSLPPGSEGRGGELLSEFGLSTVTRPVCWKWAATAASDKSSATKDEDAQCFMFGFKIKAGQAKHFDLLIGDAKEGYFLGRHARESGGWTVVGNLNFLRNKELKRDSNAALAWQVLAPTLHGGKVYLVYAANVPPLYVLIVERGWPALLPLLLALFAWLWARSQRFGPLLPLAPVHRRALLEHVQAAGEFMFQRGRGAALYAPLQRAFLDRLRRDDPVTAALDGDAQVAALAANSVRSQAEIRQILNPVDLARPEQFFATIKTLTELRIKP